MLVIKLKLVIKLVHKIFKLNRKNGNGTFKNNPNQHQYSIKYNLEYGSTFGEHIAKMYKRNIKIRISFGV